MHGTGSPRTSGGAPAPAGDPPVRDEADAALIDAFVGASRALVAVAARSLAGIGEDVTLPQYRALVVIRTRGPQRVADLATALDVTPSTATRMVDRLVRKRLVRRVRDREDRRILRVHLSDAGERTVTEVTARRRAEIGRILDQMPARGRGPLTAALRAFAAAAGEVPSPGATPAAGSRPSSPDGIAADWALGWDT